MRQFDAAHLADIHNHLVPGVDDGARSCDESVRHLQELAAEGVAWLAVSPHLDGRLAFEPAALEARLGRLKSAFDELRVACAARPDVPALYFGQELLVPDGATARRLFAEPGVGIAGTRYALIEFGFELGPDPEAVIRAVVDGGRRPIIAHPERYRRGAAPVPVEEIRGWKRAGAILQVNGGSLLGDYEAGVEDLAWRLLAEGLGDVVASDHHADARVVSPAHVGRTLARHGAGGQAELLLSRNPRRVLNDRATLPVPPWTSRAIA